jgi:nitroreductase
MNAVIDAIGKRRSVRSYESKEIPKEILETIINCGDCAPSGGNSRAWRFVVVQDDTFRKKLVDIAVPIYKKWMENAPQGLKDLRKEIDAMSPDPIYYGAPAIVFVVGSGNTSDFDCPMVCENLMLAARSFDIGSCWVYFGQFPMSDPRVRKELELKEGEKVYGPILLGYPKDGFPDAPPKNKTVIKYI